MKQGTGSNTMHGKDPGVSRAVNLSRVAQMGAQQAYRTVEKPPLFSGKGRGSSSPKSTTTAHCCGTQGKY
jgi:hypothetical protein